MNQIEENKQLYAQGAASQVSSDPTLSSAATSANKETYKAATPNAQLFTSYFMSTHGQDGHMTGDAPSLSINEQLEM